MLLAICLAACSPKHEQPAPQAPAAAVPAPAAAVKPVPIAPAADAPTPAPDKQHQAWMQAIFGSAFDAKQNHALVVIDAEGGGQHHLMTLKATSVLPDGRIVIVVNGLPSDEHGKDMTGRASGGVLNVYIVRADAGGWQVLERREDLASMGSDGQIGGVDWVMLGPGKPGFTVTSFYTGQGQSVSLTDIVELGNGMRHLGNVTLSSDNGGACTIETDECWEVEGSAAFAGDTSADGYYDLLAVFKGKRYRLVNGKDGGEVEQVRETIQNSARYRLDGAEYKLVAGANPITDQSTTPTP
jgi:hypothetical protein